PHAYEDLGLAQLLDGEYGAAEKSFQAAVDVKPEDPETFTNLANYYKGQNAPDRAEQVLRQGMTKNSKAVELPIAQAGLYTERGRLQDAKQILLSIETAKDNFPDGRRAVAEFYLANGEPTLALERFRALVEQNEHDQSAIRKVAE